MVSTTTPKRCGRTRVTERLITYVTPSAKAVIRRATAISGLAVGDFAYQGARRVLQDRERIALARKNRAAFLRALSNLPNR